MKFWKYSRVALALIGSVVLGLSITCCGVYTTGYMYVTGAQFNQIGAYKIDHDFGYLTPVTGSPFANAGGTPVQAAIIPGGRYLAVVSQGTPGVAGTGSVSIYSIGGGGVIAFQHSYFTSGINPVAIALAPAGNYLYVLDQMAPPDVVNKVDQNAGRGDVTVFAIDGSSGKLTLITNQNTFNTNGTQLPYFTVNYNPVQMVTASGFLYVLDQGYNASLATPTPPAACVNAPAGSPCATPDVFLYAINTSNGQLTLTQNAPLTLAVQAGAASTIALGGSGKYVYVTDNALGASSGRILPFTIGSGGVLQSLVGGPTNNVPNVTYPDAVIANSNAQFLYVANYGPSSIFQGNSSISAFTISTANGQLQQLPVSSGSNPFQTGAGPIWMVIDPTNQYLYTADHNSNTVTGHIMGATNGQLSNLFKGTTFPTVGQPTFAVVTGRTY
ncbi:MAG TPA: beta-propeller fold lactonase family protein [Acidobacteriaceae bacterium]|nr:beta-propeller fold lactonase family protein [Acidobacteriaceae bacterium]